MAVKTVLPMVTVSLARTLAQVMVAVAAVIVAKGERPSTDELAAWVKARLRSTKTPEVWAFRDALPYNDTGTLLRRQLKAELSKPMAPV